MVLIHLFEKLVTMHPLWSYGVILIGMILEGDVVLVVSGVLSHVGVLHVVPTLSVLVLGAVLKTIVWYSLGVLIKYLFPNSTVLKYIERKVLYLLPHFPEKPFWSVFTSKFMYGLNHAVMIFSGYTGISFREFAKAEIISTFCWIVILFPLGLFFSYAAFSFTHDLRFVLLILFGFVFGILIVHRFLGQIIEYFQAK
jgi:membrane protein DedA with SNARE-associated domain